MAAFKLWYIVNWFNSSSSKAAIRNFGKILKNQLRRNLFLNLIKLSASNCHVVKMGYIRGFSRILSKFYTICFDLLEFSEHLFQRTPFDDCFYTFWKHLFFRTIFYFKKSEKSMTLWIIFLPSAKNSNFFWFLQYTNSCNKHNLTCCLTFGT